jgi:hypothetical protein
LGARSETLTFNAVSADAIRYGFDNSIGQSNILASQITHCWLHEVQVFNTTIVPEPTTLYLFATGIGMLVRRPARRQHALG